MPSQSLLTDLLQYGHFWVHGRIPYEGMALEEEASVCNRIMDFLSTQGAAYERSCLEGHMTASALVTDQTMSQVLLIHHAKLDKWLQLGGHMEGEYVAANAALREAQEESGLTSLTLWHWEQLLVASTPSSPVLPFDLDIHLIPARAQEPEHFHYDVRYLLRAEANEPLQANHEAKDLRWMSLAEAHQITQEPSMLRQFRKLEALKQQFLARKGHFPESLPVRS